MARNNTKEHILDTAEELFAHQGFAATSVTDIANEVGIRGPAVYKHYSNKLAIYEAVLHRRLDPLREVVDDISRGSDLQSLSYQLNVVMRHHIQHPNIARLIQHATLAGGKPLETLVEKWFKPFFQHIHKLAIDDRYPWVTIPSVMAFHSLIMGYVTLAPMHEALFDSDPLDETMVQQQLQLYEDLIKGLHTINGDPSTDSPHQRQQPRE